MKAPTVLAPLAALATLAASCTSAPTQTATRDLDPNSGPSIVYTRTAPGTIELNPDFTPKHPAEVLADVKDFTSKISDVKLQFVGVPLEIPMENVGGSTWRARLTPRQLEMLSVTGQTIHYEAHVIARDTEGKISSTRIPVEVAIRTPELPSIATGAG